MGYNPGFRGASQLESQSMLTRCQDSTEALPHS